MTSYSVVLDVAGRPSQSDKSPYLVGAAIVFRTDDIERVRTVHAAPSAKWTRAPTAEAIEQVRFALDHAVAIVVFRVRKEAPAWQDFWSKADEYHERMAREVRRPVGFVKAGTVLRYWMFAEPAVRAVGDALRLDGLVDAGRTTPLPVRTNLICDSDLSGEENIAVFREMLAGQGSRPQEEVRSLGLHHEIGQIDLRREEEDSLVFLSDYVAGLFHSCPPELDALAEELRVHEKVKVVEYAFDIKYGDIFGSSRIGRSLWPAV